MLKPGIYGLAGSISAALGFAGLGLALYANGPAGPAALLFGTVGAVAGALCSGLHIVFDGPPQVQPAAVPVDELARLVRATLANAAGPRPAGSGTARDRQPVLPAPAPAPATARPTLAGGPAGLAVVGAPATATAPEASQPVLHPPATGRQFANSAFGA